MITINNLIDLLSEVTETDKSQFDKSTNFKSITYWDSMCDLTLIASLDEKYKIHISGDILDNVNTVEELYNEIK